MVNKGRCEVHKEIVKIYLEKYGILQFAWLIKIILIVIGNSNNNNELITIQIKTICYYLGFRPYIQNWPECCTLYIAVKVISRSH